MEMVKISSLITDKISGEWGSDALTSNAVNVIRTANFTNSGKITFHNLVKREIERKIVERKKLLNGDIIIEKSGGSPNQPVGRVVYFENPDNSTFLCNNFTSILRPNKGKVNPKYLFYLLSNFYQTDKVLSFQNKTTGIINLKLDRYLDSEILFEPNLETQNKIVAILDKAKGILDKREATIKKYDELLRATFLEMFDPYQGLNLYSLIELTDITSGLTKGKRYGAKQTRFIPYMRVANVQDGFLDLNEIKEIEATNDEIKRYTLQKNDLLLTEGGDPDKLGRGTLWKNQIKNCIFQNHIFRVRITDPRIINPTFLSFQIASYYGKSYFLKAAKQTSGIASINSTQLKAFPVYVPPIELQNKFEQIVSKAEKIKSSKKVNLKITNDLFHSILQLAFKGELGFNTAVDLEVLLENDYQFFKENSNSSSIQLLLERLNTDELNKNRFYEQQTYNKAKSFVFELIKEEKVKQVYDDITKKVKLTVE
ncbi:restriction endonuclease subunit S [Flectobacillus roseus]|uniref:Restriction endonuclease subunit S n=1 Tax=Flectobacillus roseus TaxID=502259 RepID=A0ABT6Y2J8_9BACT|nr:restriction endonuclease subunit S [Flectobacillus roseus]MDI9857772.1 restriction endonuclease subunit S [Flectobacillus roseus]